MDLDALTETTPDTTLPDMDTTPPDTETTPPEEGAIEEENQVADIQGNVSINVVDTSGLTIKTKIDQSLGEQAQSQRESFYRAIKSSMKGILLR